jgi:hypothetical protein
VTVKTPELVAVPPGVVIAIFPVFAPVGTLAVTWVSEFTVKVVALTPPKVTFVVSVRLTLVIIAGVPTLPLGGVKLRICGVTWNCLLLVSVVEPVATVTLPSNISRSLACRIFGLPLHPPSISLFCSGCLITEHKLHKV